MGSLNKRGFDAGELANILRPTKYCFYCGDVMTGKNLVYWHGNDEIGQEIWMHPKCARKLSIHLSKDSK